MYAPGPWVGSNRCTMQVEEKRTPLQLSMDELAQKLSMISFAIIGVICIIGVIQSRSWLEMFTIGGTFHAVVMSHGAGLTIEFGEVQYHLQWQQYPKACLS